MSRNLNKLLNYSLLKVSLIPIMLWIISSLVFILLRVAPGDPIDAILGSGANEVSREILRNKLGLNEESRGHYHDEIVREVEEKFREVAGELAPDPLNIDRLRLNRLLHQTPDLPDK